MSPGLVSRVLNNDSTLSLREETRTAVLQAVEELGYEPHASARALRKSRSATLGLVLTDVTSPMFTDMVAGAQRAALEAGYVVVLMDANDAEVSSPLFAGVIASGRLDGLLLQGGYSTTAHDLQQYATRTPSVVFNAPGAGGTTSVWLQDEEATQIAVQHLCELGHRDIAFLTGEPGPTSDRRSHAFVAEMRSLGHEVHSSKIISSGWSADQSHAAIRAYLAEHSPPTAVIAANAGVAVGALSALHTEGHNVPEQISVIAIHDTWFAAHLRPALSTVRLPLRELGRIAVEQLVAKIEGGTVSDVLITDPAPELVRRESTTTAPRSSS